MHPGLRTIVFSILVPGTVAGYVPYVLLRGSQAPAGAHWFGLAPLVLGVAGYVWCAWHFSFTGRGTPGPWDPPRQLVVVGPYRFVRNPMYESVLLVIAGECVLFWSARLLGYLVAVALGFHLFVLVIEEPILRSMFGAEYKAYCDAVHRWLPRSRPTTTIVTRTPK